MPRVEQSVTINRPVAEVFDFAGRDYVRNLPKWSTATREFRQTSQGGMKVGTTIQEVREIRGKPTPASVEITEYVPNQTVAFKSVSDANKSTGRFTFEPAGNGTKVTFVLDAEVGGLGRLAGPMIGREMSKGIESDMANMKRLIEQQPG